MEFPSDDQLLASAARFLIDGREDDAAVILLSCTFRFSLEDYQDFGETHYRVQIDCRAPRFAYDVLSDHNHSITSAIRRAFEALIPAGTYIDRFNVRGEIVEPDPDWKNELLEIARGKKVNNQGNLVQSENIRTWKGLQFRSVSEIRIAEALDSDRVLFFPNCASRLNLLDGRGNREADFLVCHDGKWGVLEVDGEPFHPPARTVHDHTRDRLFLSHGIRLVQHYDATRCFRDGHGVVKEFLDLLKKS